MPVLNVNELSMEEKPLHVPSLDELATVLTKGLKHNFGEVSVSVERSPDLTQAPFHLAGEGLSGSATLLDVGGPSYLYPLVDRSKLYELVSIARKTLPNAEEILTIGAGAGPFPVVNSNSEGIFNLKINADKTITNNSYAARVSTDDEHCELIKLPESETRCAVLANLYVSEGKPGQVLRIKCRDRIGDDSLITNIRETIASHYVGKTVGLGGVFLMRNGKAKHNIMRDFSKTPIFTEDELNTWLKFYDMPGTLTLVGTLITDEADLDLRLQHFHSFSSNGCGGHFHNDTTPDTVEYEAYFNVAERIVRVDKPLEAHTFGRN